MSEKYSIESKDGVTIIRYSKNPGVKEVCDALDDVAENYLSALRLWDISAGFNPPQTELETMAEYAKYKFPIPSRSAIVASDDLSFGLSRVFNFHREEENVAQQVFRSEEEAMLWLKK
jgi:hypothetical protein